MTTALTPRESEVLSLLAQGRTAREAGAQLGVCLKTVESHVASIRTRLDLRGADFRRAYRIAYWSAVKEIAKS